MSDDTRDDADGGRGADPVGPAFFPVFVLFEAALAPLALALGWALGQPALEGFAWDGRAAVLGVLGAGPMVAFLAVSVRRPVGPLRGLKEFFHRELAPALRGCGWADLALISVAAGVGEEMLFRGVIQGALARALGPGAGLAAAAALFGLLHPASAAYVVVAGVLGAYLGLLWLGTGNLLTPMVAHALYDFVALVVLLRDRDAAADPDRG